MIRLAVVGIATLGFMMSTSPVTLPAMLLIAPFVGMFCFLYLLILEVLRFLGPDEEAGGAVVRLRRPRLMAAVIAGFPILLLVLQSIVLTKWDVLIALAIVLLAYVYISRSSVSFKRQQQ